MLSNVFGTPRFLLALVVAAGAALAGSPATAKAASFAMITIDNPTDAPIHYQFKWGSDGDWEDGCVDPGCYVNHWVELDEDGRAPTPYIRFDDACGNVVEYRLDFYASRTRGYHQGKIYFFQADWNGCLDLKAK